MFLICPNHTTQNYMFLIYNAGVSKNKLIRFTDKTLAALEAIRQHYGGDISDTTAVIIAITHEAEYIELLEAKRQRVRKKRITSTPIPPTP